MRRRCRGRNESVLSLHMCMYARSGSIPRPIAKSSLLRATCHSRRGKSGLLGIPAERGPRGPRGPRGRAPEAASIAGVAGTLCRLAAGQPEPEREKDQDEKDAAADSSADDRPRGSRVRITCRGSVRGGVRIAGLGHGGGDGPGAIRRAVSNYCCIAYTKVIVNAILHPLHVADWQTYTKRSSSQVLGGVGLATVILMVWSPLLRPSFLNNWIGTPSWAAKELTVCWSAPSVDDGSEEKTGKFVFTYQD